jgi:hypothetical protein
VCLGRCEGRRVCDLVVGFCDCLWWKAKGGRRKGGRREGGKEERSGNTNKNILIAIRFRPHDMLPDMLLKTWRLQIAHHGPGAFDQDAAIERVRHEIWGYDGVIDGVGGGKGDGAAGLEVVGYCYDA